MFHMIKTAKDVIRKKVLELLGNQKEEDRCQKSQRIKEKLFAASEFQKAQTILFYASFDGEVETFEMIRQAQKLGKKISLPKIVKDQKKMIPCFIEDVEDLTLGPYGIKEPKEDAIFPVDLDELDLAVVPGVAFDRKNVRLGRGAGYYDRFLRCLPSRIPTFGLAFDFQMVDTLPYQKDLDIPVSRVIVN